MKITYSVANVQISAEAGRLTGVLIFVNGENSSVPVSFVSENDAAAFIQDKLRPGAYTVIKIYSKD